MKPTPEVLAKLRAVLALAERGVDGEQTLARETLARLMEKHRLTLDELKGADGSGEFRFEFRGSDEEELLAGLICKTAQVCRFHWRTGRGFALVTLPKHVGVSVGIYWPDIRKAWRKERRATLKAAHAAFHHTNSLFGPDDGTPAKPCDLSPDEVARIVSLMESMTAVPTHKRLS
jgi:hypothetical protein